MTTTVPDEQSYLEAAEGQTDTRKKRRILEAALMHHPVSVGILVTLAKLLFHTDIGQAETFALKAHSEDPTNIDALLVLLRQAIGEGNEERIRKWADRILEIDDGNVAAREALRKLSK